MFSSLRGRYINMTNAVGISIVAYSIFVIIHLFVQLVSIRWVGEIEDLSMVRALEVSWIIWWRLMVAVGIMGLGLLLLNWIYSDRSSSGE